MKIIYFGNGVRGLNCLTAILEAGHDVPLIVVPPNEKAISAYAKKNKIKCISPDDPNSSACLKTLRALDPDLFVLSGYGKILKRETIDIPKLMAINTHAGKLPERRGSSPMNWALMADDPEFTLSVIKIDHGIDTGEILSEKTFSIHPNDTIKDLHNISSEEFPRMVLNVIDQLQQGTCHPKGQDHAKAKYYPLRFPEDGMIIWDLYSAEEIHNLIRALSEPYPCLSIYKGELIKLRGSKLSEFPCYGEPGRVYRKSETGLLICAKDQCLWITDAVFAKTNKPLQSSIKLYDELVTVRKTVVAAALKKK